MDMSLIKMKEAMNKDQQEIEQKKTTKLKHLDVIFNITQKPQ